MDDVVIFIILIIVNRYTYRYINEVSQGLTNSTAQPAWQVLSFVGLVVLLVHLDLSAEELLLKPWHQRPLAKC